jgi:hypothetical protein
MKRDIVGLLLILGVVSANWVINEPDSKERALVVEVRESGTGCPLPGALVLVSGFGQRMLTDSLGRVYWPAKVTLSEEVTATCAGYENGTSAPWLVNADTVETSLELVPKSPRTVTGTVEDSKGRALSGARAWIATDTAETDSTGWFVLKHTHVSPRYLQVSFPGLPCCTREFRLAGHDVVVVHAALHDTMGRGDIVGRVFDGWNGGAVVGVPVEVDGTDLGIVSDANGYYSFRGLRPGDYLVVCSATRGLVKCCGNS